MFLGRFAHTIDDKNRLTIPAKYRGDLASGVVITRGIDRCLYIYPLAEWERLAERVRQLPLTDKNARAFVRLLFSGAEDCTPDKQGRVLIPTHLLEYANLNGDVIVAGLHSRLEVWNAQSWRQEDADLDKSAGALAEALAVLNVL